MELKLIVVILCLMSGCTPIYQMNYPVASEVQAECKQVGQAVALKYAGLTTDRGGLDGLRGFNAYEACVKAKR